MSTRIGVVQFPGTNCERETARSLSACCEGDVDILWHADPFPADAYAAESVRQLAVTRKDPACRVAAGPGAMHGVNMLDPTMTQKLLDWMKAQ